MVDPSTLNPVEQVDQYTAFVLTPICLRCGSGGLSKRIDKKWRCDGCHRIVTIVEYADKVFNRKASKRLHGN